jgi:hypothetical protein
MNKNGLKDSNLGKFYLSQGMFQKHIPTNDCGPTSVAMIINMIRAQSGIRDKKVTKKEVALFFPLLGRLPNWIPKTGGASAPWGLVKAFNYFAQENRILWEARRVSHADPALISKILQESGFVSILRFWENGGAHWSNVVYFDPGKGVIHLLDPSPYLVHLPDAEKIQIEDWKMVKQDWERQPSWAKYLGLKREIIIYQSNEK